MSQESEPCIIEYARHYGLARDHRAAGPLESIPVLDENLYLTSLESFTNEVETFLESTAMKGVLPTERMFVDVDTAKLLSSIIQPAQSSHHFDENIDMPTLSCKKLKHGLPLLLSDHESDVHELLRRFEPNFENEFLPFESLNEEGDEGFTWPSKYLKLPNNVWEKLTAEKLEISAEVLHYLSAIVCRNKPEGSLPVFEIDEEAQFKYKRSIVPTPVTPPILPMSPSHFPFIPSSEVGHLDLLSEQPSPTKEQLRTIEQQIFAKDAITTSKKAAGLSLQSSDPMLLDSDNIGAIFSPLKGIKDLPSSPPDDRLPAQKLKVEVPLIIAEPEVGLQWSQKNVSFGATLTEIIPSLPIPLPEYHDDEIMNEINAFFDEAIKPIAEKAERNIEQEQLQEADTTRRVSVPVMDFSLPQAPWSIAHKQSCPDDVDIGKYQILKDMKTLYFKDHLWFLSGKIERELQWTPFPAAMGKVELHEAIRDDGNLAAFLAQPIPSDTNMLTWKPEGLRLFDTNRQYVEEELEEGSFCEATDLQSLIRKRKMELLEDDSTFTESKSEHVRSKRVFKLMGSDNSSCLRSLEDFMQVRKGTVNPKQLLINQHPQQRPTTQTPVEDAAVDQWHMKDTHANEIEMRFEPALPDTAISTKRQSFITSATFLKNRKLVRQIQKLLPAAELIERDWYRHLQPQVIAPQSKPVSDPSVNEADIILSPSTGLILTTLQIIKQQPLPGQTAQATIRERIRRTAPRYETLIILISADHHPDEHDQIPFPRDLDHNDCEAIAVFIAFCSNLEDEVQAIFVPGENEELSRWIAAMMAKHSASHTNVQLVQDETLWELFLRRAGLNAFAAQAILSELDRRNLGTEGSEDWGLPAFAKMSADKRLARFERVFGGRRLLSKVNDVLEARW